MDALFTFYNVGQGTFYGGAIKHNNQNFVVVYDCGSVTRNNPLNQPIQEFRGQFDHIDLLIVSHFDIDHVNGISDLIRGRRVERIVLPYMPLIKRLALIASQDEDEEDFVSFVSNPTEYLNGQEFNVGTIAYVNQGGADEVTDEINPVDIPKFDRDLQEDFEFGEFFMEMPNDLASEESILGEDPELNSDNTRYLSFNTRLTIGAELWEFVFYHRKTTDETDITDFTADVDKYCEDEGNIQVRELFTLDRRAKMKEMYEKHINGNVNYSSLCVFHQPMFRSNIIGFVRFIEGDQHRRLVFPWRWRHRRWRLLRSGTLLTGDQFLKEDVDFNPFYQYFNSRLNRTEIYQVPHHGSDNNWRYMPCELNQHDIGCYVINHGYGRQHHPNQYVLQNLLTFANRDVVLNNEHTRLEYEINPIITRQTL